MFKHHCYQWMAIAVAGLVSACTISEQTAPPLTGPSEYGLSLGITALPDTLTFGGAAAVIEVTARQFDASPANREVRLEIQALVNGVYTPISNFGRLSTHVLFTGSSGRASALYIPPPMPAPGYSPLSTDVRIVASIVGTNRQTSDVRDQTVDLRLVLPITNNPSAPVALFTWSPTSPAVNQETLFNASASYPVTGTRIVNYAWDWGDGTTDNTNPVPNEDHDWVAPGVYYVTLTVEDDRGQRGSTTQAITVQ